MEKEQHLDLKEAESLTGIFSQDCLVLQQLCDEKTEMNLDDLEMHV